jgi:Mrp family chromosome partitioning ATPase
MLDLEEAFARLSRWRAHGNPVRDSLAQNLTPPLNHAPPSRWIDGVPRPGWTVRWPPLVRKLLDSYPDRFENLAERLTRLAYDESTKVVLFTSCHRAEGRTTLLLALAHTLASRSQTRTLLVDADFAGPMLARSLGLVPRQGLEELACGTARWSDTQLPVAGSSLTLLPLRAPVPAPRNMFSGPGWPCLMARARRGFDLVLLDGGPLFAGLAASLLKRTIDGAILVHHQGLTANRSILRAREVLDANGILLLGLAETFAEPSRPVRERSPDVLATLRPYGRSALPHR